MYFNFKLIALLLSVVYQNILGQKLEGDSCRTDSSRTNGTCKLIKLCPSALEAIKSRNIYPTYCGFQATMPIVCCVEDLNPGAVSLPTKIAITSTTIKVTSNSTTQTMVTTSSTGTHKPILQVGDKSKQKCIEYGEYVYEDVGITSIRGPLPKVSNCAVIEVENIVSGTPAKPKEFPHMALIDFDGDDNEIHWDCGGTLISENFVLSAAHCEYHNKLLAFAKHILLGELVLDSNTDARPEQISIKNIILHPKYISPSNYHDLALFELEHKATLSIYVRPACLNINPNLINRLGVATGWGLTSTYGSASKEMQKVTLDVFTDTECNLTYGKVVGPKLDKGIDKETQLCSGSRNEDKDTCYEDSGGPLQIINSKEVFCTYKIIGITSFGKTCGEKGIPGVYTRVSTYIKWIEDTIWP